MGLERVTCPHGGCGWRFEIAMGHDIHSARCPRCKRQFALHSPAGGVPPPARKPVKANSEFRKSTLANTTSNHVPEHTCPECDGKFDTEDRGCGFAGVCPLCGEWIELDDPHASTVASEQSRRQVQGNVGPEQVKYFQVPMAKHERYLCSDRACPCPGTERLIPGKTGFLYISEEVVELRSDALTIEEFLRKLETMETRTGLAIGVTFTGTQVLNPILLCREGAERRGLDLYVAGEDAKYVFKTGRCPLRPTPKQKTDHSTNGR